MTSGLLYVLAATLVVTTVTSTSSGTYTTEDNSSVSSSVSSSPTFSPYTYDLHPDYPGCDSQYALSNIGSGFCTTSSNVASCGWDGGDCCMCTCNSNSSHGCQYLYGDTLCKDPSAPIFLESSGCQDPLAPIYFGASGCQNVSFQVPQTPHCSRNHTNWVISTTANAAALAEATKCSGGYFEVEWRDHVGVNETIHVLNGTRVKITGTSNAVADGGGVVHIFLVYNGSLEINNMTITNGTGDEGGAIILDADSELIADNVVFSSNTAQNVGGAIYSASSYVELMSTTFDGNTAPSGGAMFLCNSAVVGVDSNSFTSNNASQNGGALYIMGASHVGWNMQLMYNGTTVDSSIRYSICGRSLYYHLDCYWDVIGDKSGETFFLNNSAGISGGAMYVSTSDVSWSGMASIEQNNAWYGGALYLDRLATVKIQGATTFASNNAMFNGGAVGATDGYVEVNGSTIFMNNTCGRDGGAIYANDSNVYLLGTTWLEQNSAYSGGALYLEGGDFVAEGDITFVSNNAMFNGGAVGATDGFVEFNGSTIFTNNTCGGNGGAIVATDGSVTFDGSTIFTNNTCGVNGGAIELSTSDLYTHGNATFLQNSAGSFGGALYASRMDEGPTLDGITFSSNTADSGGAVFFSAVGTDLYPLSSSEYENIASYASTFNGCRFEGNSASSKGGAIYSALGSDWVWNTTFKGNSADTGGGISVSGIIYLSNSSFEDNTSSEGEGPAVFNGGVTGKTVGLYFSGNGYHCSSDTYRGFNETDVEDGRYNVVCNGCNAVCEGCTIEDDLSTPICLKLLDHTQSNGGTATLETLVVVPGYWRATDTSKNILPCFNEKACRGGVTGSPNYCLMGYEGPYCAVCSQGYVRTISYRCSECSLETSFGPAVFAISGGLAGLLLMFFVYYMIRIERGRTPRHSIDSFKKVLAVQSLKIVIVSWQIVTQFSEVTNVVYPSLYQGLLDVVAVVNFDFSWILSAGCFDVDFYVGLIAATAGPLVIMVLLGVTLAIALHRNRGSDVGQRIVRRKHVNAIILLAFLVYSSASSAVFKTFVCDSLDDGKTYLRADYRIICTSPKHEAFQMYAGCMIALYPLGIPVLFAILLFRNRKVLENVALRTYNGELVQQSTSSLWKPYKPSVFYYEVVECGRRLMLTGIMVFIYPNTAAQIAVTLAIAFMFALMSERLKPYESKWDGWVARIGHVMVVLTMFVALLTKVDVSDEGIQSQNVFAAILVTAHTAMVLTGVTEAFLLIRSVQEDDAPMRRPRNISVLPVENFSSIHDRGGCTQNLACRSHMTIGES